MSVYIIKVELIPHPAANCAAVRRLTASCRRAAAGVLLLTYRLEGDMGGLRVPGPAVPQRADELWRHTCLEAFIQPAGQRRYAEFNFSPGTRWAAYGFADYRAGMQPLALRFDPQLAVVSAADVLVLTARVALPAEDGEGPLRVGLTAVVEDSSGRSSWWALRHAGERPDFHLAASFVYEC